ncbi:MAG TPA: RodZ domain-containing protein [Candidatus Sulfomarinibacteraceae bacterium]|nr:RodZ domain-containing protein [Candidatus Sulfomarinibacteraceae bacterium]
MDELGIILRDAREMKGLTLAEVQEKTRISARYLEAMESGEYHLLPTPVHVRGFLRNYARFLDLDPEPLLERYEANENARPQVTASSSTANGDGLTARNDQPFFNPVNVDLEGNADGNESRVRLVIIVALLITIGLAASRFVPMITGNGDGRDNLPEMIESLMSQEAEPAADAVPDGTTTPEATEGIAATIIPSGRNDPIGAATDEAAPPAPTQAILPATMDHINLRLDITERTWVRVTIDGEVVLEDQVTREDGPFEWEAEQEAHVRTGNAAGVFININDTDIGKLGGRGEVAEQTWTTTTTGN